VTAYQVMPGLAPDEYAALRADIAEHGVRVPVDVDENGQVLDGHHRSLIAAELGIVCPRRVLEGLSEPEKVAHALAVNVHRRNLTREQRRDLLAASIKAAPELSDREHGRRTGVDHKTSAAVRQSMETTGEIPQLHSRRGADGHERPATQPPRPTPISKVTHTTTDKTVEETVIDTSTGEVLTGDEWKQQNPGPSVAEYLDDDDAKDRAYMRAFLAALSKASEITTFDPERVGPLLTELELPSVQSLGPRVTSFINRAERARSGLRVITGGQQ
jgi:hypothetical protein